MIKKYINKNKYDKQQNKPNNKIIKKYNKNSTLNWIKN